MSGLALPAAIHHVCFTSGSLLPMGLMIRPAVQSRRSLPLPVAAEDRQAGAFSAGRRKVSDGHGVSQTKNIPESSRRGPWLPVRSRPVRDRITAEGGRRCSSTCRGGCWSSTPSSSCRGAPCRCTWPGAAQALVGFVVCRPVFAFFSSRAVAQQGRAYHILLFPRVTLRMSAAVRR